MLNIAHEGIYELCESNVRSYCRSIPVEFVSAENAILTATSGQNYLDFLSGCGSLNYGHNDPDMKQALLTYISNNGIAHSLDLHTQAKNTFISVFAKQIMEPRQLDYKIQFAGPTGTNAVEAALKLARKATGRTNIIAFTNGFHGVSLGALAATGNNHNRRAAGIALGGISRMPYDRYYGEAIDTIDALDRMLSDPSSGIDSPAAFIVEAVQGEGGLNVASNAWLGRLRTLANHHGALLILDDVQAGCGRTGTFFSFEIAGIVPDIVILAKSLSGFGLPLAAILMRRELDIWEPGEHNGTFRGNNHAFVTAAVAISKFWANDDFSVAVKDRSASVEIVLNTLFSQTGWQPKGRGLMRGLRCPSKEIAAQVRDRCFHNGLVLEMCGPHDEILKLMPPLTIEKEAFEDGLSRFSEAVLAVDSGACVSQPGKLFATA